MPLLGLKFPHFPVKIGLFWGVGGSPNFFLLESSYFCYLGAHAKFQIPSCCLYGRGLKFPHFPVKIGLFGGVGGVPEIFFLLESSYFCYLGGHAKFQNRSSSPYRLVGVSGRRRRRFC